MGARDGVPNGGLDASATLASGELLAGTDYRVVKLLGTGAMGEVYEAVHVPSGARRALKVLGVRHGGRREMIERIRAEARSLSRLRHPNLVEVLELGIAENGRWFFAMELLEGETLRERVARTGPLSPLEASRIIRAVLEGLGAAHTNGIVHRDVKPENVFVADGGVVKVLDFGIAKFLEPGAVPLTQSGMTVGTPRYMAPEQVEGRGVDARTDVYAVGVVLYEILSGNAPFEDDDALALAYAHVSREVPELGGRTNGRVPAALDALVVRALAKRPDDRFANAAAFRDALSALEPALPDTRAADLGPNASREAVTTDPARLRTRVIATPSEVRSRRSRSSAWRWAVAGAVLAAIVVATILGSSMGSRRETTHGPPSGPSGDGP